MHVAVQIFRLGIPGADSLKAKRMVVKSLRARIRRQFNVSVAESGLHEIPQTAELTVAVVADSRARADATLDHVDTMIESDGRALIQHTEREFR